MSEKQTKRAAIDAPQEQLPPGVRAAVDAIDRGIAALDAQQPPDPAGKLDRMAALAADARALLYNGGCDSGPNDSQRKRIDAILREIAGLPSIACTLVDRVDQTNPDTTRISPVGRTVGSERTSGYSEMFYCPIKPRLEQTPTMGVIDTAIHPAHSDPCSNGEHRCACGKFVGRVPPATEAIDPDNSRYAVTGSPSPYKRGCKLAGPGRGDCEHFIGLFDGQKNDHYGIPEGWCDYCWASYRTRPDTCQSEQPAEQPDPREAFEAWFCYDNASNTEKLMARLAFEAGFAAGMGR